MECLTVALSRCAGLVFVGGGDWRRGKSAEGERGGKGVEKGRRWCDSFYDQDREAWVYRGVVRLTGEEAERHGVPDGSIVKVSVCVGGGEEG